MYSCLTKKWRATPLCGESNHPGLVTLLTITAKFGSAARTTATRVTRRGSPKWACTCCGRDWQLAWSLCLFWCCGDSFICHCSSLSLENRLENSTRREPGKVYLILEVRSVINAAANLSSSLFKDPLEEPLLLGVFFRYTSTFIPIGNRSTWWKDTATLLNCSSTNMSF